MTIYAHINRAITVVDDGARTETYFVDSGNYPTLFCLKGVKQVSNDLTILGHIEYTVQSNAATAVSQDNQEAGLDISSRFFEMATDSKRYGKVTFGRGFMSSFIAVELDKSETWYYNLLSPGNSFGGMKFVNSADNSLTDLTVNEIFLDIEAFSFRDRIRYDSPVWGGAQISGSLGSGNSGDITLRWNQKVGDYDLFVGASAQNNPVVGRIDERFDGGIAVLHEPSGINFTLAGVKQKFTKNFYESFGRTEGNSDGLIVRVGLRRNWFTLGETRFAIDTTNSTDVLYASDEGKSFGAFFGQMIDDWNAELYTGYRIYDYDTGPNSGGLSVHTMHGFTVGARIWFDATFGKS